MRLRNDSLTLAGISFLFAFGQKGPKIGQFVSFLESLVILFFLKQPERRISMILDFTFKIPGKILGLE